MRKPLISVLTFGLIFSSSVFAGVSNCELKVADAVKEIMKRDSDANGKVSVKKSLAAYEYFDSLIRDLSKIESKAFRKAIYTSILKNEKIPSRASSIAMWAAQKPFWKYERNETQIKNAMNSLYQCQP